jgi:hypothetical protein
LFIQSNVLHRLKHFLIYFYGISNYENKIIFKKNEGKGNRRTKLTTTQNARHFRPNSLQGALLPRLVAHPKQINVALTLPSSCRKNERDEKGFFHQSPQQQPNLT